MYQTGWYTMNKDEADGRIASSMLKKQGRKKWRWRTVQRRRKTGGTGGIGIGGWREIRWPKKGRKRN